MWTVRGRPCPPEHADGSTPVGDRCDPGKVHSSFESDEVGREHQPRLSARASASHSVWASLWASYSSGSVKDLDLITSWWTP